MNRCNSCRGESVDLCLSGRCVNCCKANCTASVGHYRPPIPPPAPPSGRFVLIRTTGGVELVLIWRKDSGVEWADKSTVKHMADGAQLMIYVSRKAADNAAKVHGGNVTPDTDIL